MTRRDDLYSKARRVSERGDAACWEAAEAMTELADQGETGRQIADRLECSEATVRRYIAVWRASLGRMVLTRVIAHPENRWLMGAAMDDVIEAVRRWKSPAT